jgi:GNAT superfamily N-acetyltransferase
VARSDGPLSIDDRPTDADVAAVLRGLLAFNEARIGPAGEQPVRFVVRDAGDAVIGGLLGHTRWGWMHIEKLWVSDAARGQGLGTRLMAAAEELAMQRSCMGVMLHTFEHQARPFYERLGYALFGTLEGYPAGTRQHYLYKRLPAPVQAPSGTGAGR